MSGRMDAEHMAGHRRQLREMIGLYGAAAVLGEVALYMAEAADAGGPGRTNATRRAYRWCAQRVASVAAKTRNRGL